ncbi:hypothetical protein DVH26_07150 [Paenibacillus sp. H1-7]|nr:hypothetical protein DVH26_07150 [Paenibacillus sp. H1-7]
MRADTPAITRKNRLTAGRICESADCKTENPRYCSESKACEPMAPALTRKKRLTAGRICGVAGCKAEYPLFSSESKAYGRMAPAVTRKNRLKAGGFANPQIVRRKIRVTALKAKNAGRLLLL